MFYKLLIFETLSLIKLFYINSGASFISFGCAICSKLQKSELFIIIYFTMFDKYLIIETHKNIKSIKTNKTKRTTPIM